jgi:hypothetical protein
MLLTVGVQCAVVIQAQHAHPVFWHSTELR